MKKIKFLVFLTMFAAIVANGLPRPLPRTHLLCDDSLDPALCPGGVNTGECTDFCNNSENCAGFTNLHAACVSAGGAFECKCTGSPG